MGTYIMQWTACRSERLFRRNQTCQQDVNTLHLVFQPLTVRNTLLLVKPTSLQCIVCSRSQQGQEESVSSSFRNQKFDYLLFTSRIRVLPISKKSLNRVLSSPGFPFLLSWFTYLEPVYLLGMKSRLPPAS